MPVTSHGDNFRTKIANFQPKNDKHFLFICAILISWKFANGRHRSDVGFFLYYAERGGFIIKHKFHHAKSLPGAAGIVLGAAVIAASFFILRGYLRSGEDIKTLERRVQELEHYHLYEAYKEQGLC